MTSVSGGNRQICDPKTVRQNSACWNAAFSNEFSVLASKKKTVISRIGLTVLRFWRTDKKTDYRQKDRRNGPFVRDSPRSIMKVSAF